MPSTNWLLNKLIDDFPKLTFTASDDFRWSPQTKTVFFAPNDAHISARLLHEVAHATLEHSDYSRDISLIAMERDAWHYAQTVLAPKYQVILTDDEVQDDMDTYRDWLHARSTCPACDATGLQIGKKTYQCVACHQAWEVNKALVCSLRRYKR